MDSSINIEEKDSSEFFELPYKTYTPSKTLHDTEILNMSTFLKKQDDKSP